MVALSSVLLLKILGMIKTLALYKQRNRLSRRILLIESPWRALLLEILGMRPTSSCEIILRMTSQEVLGFQHGLSDQYE